MAITYGTVKKNEFYVTKGQALEDYKTQLLWLIETKFKDKDTVNILDPCAGTKSLDIDLGDKVVYDLYDLDPKSDDVTEANFLEHDFGDKHYDICVCNPPFSLKKQFFNKISKLADYVVYISPLTGVLPDKMMRFSIKGIYAHDFEGIATTPFIFTYSFKDNTENTEERPHYRRLSRLSTKIYYDDYDMSKCAIFRIYWRFGDLRDLDLFYRHWHLDKYEYDYRTVKHNWSNGIRHGKAGDKRLLYVIIFKSTEDREKAFELIKSLPDDCIYGAPMCDVEIRLDYFKELTKYVDLDKIKEFNKRKWLANTYQLRTQTDADLYEYFKLNEEEIKEIEDVIVR